MKKIIIPAYVRMFTETIAEVEDDFDVTDGDAVDAVWMEQRTWATVSTCWRPT